MKNHSDTSVSSPVDKAVVNRRAERRNLKAINNDLLSTLEYIGTLQRADGKDWESLFYHAKDIATAAYKNARSEV